MRIHISRSQRGIHRTAALMGAVALGSAGGGCSNDLKGDLTTSIKLEGPIQLQAQMQGPTIKYEGTFISDELLGEVDVGKTTGEWVQAVFGRPDAQTELSDGTAIWRWTYRPVEQQSSMVELWSKTEKEPKLATRSVFVQVRNGTVVKKWKG